MIQCNDRVKNKIASLLWDDRVERVACLIGKIEWEQTFVLDVLPARNEDDKPAEEFFISARQMERLAGEAQRRGCILIGVAHSHLPHHPSYPSKADITYCRHAVNVMYHAASGTLSWFNPSGELWHEALVDDRAVPAAAPVLVFG
jgi:proteasome lid subunit RPN8/RPN11